MTIGAISNPDDATGLSKLVETGSKSPLALIALAMVLLAVLALYLFRKDPASVRQTIFFALLGAAILFGILFYIKDYAPVHSNPTPTPVSPPSPFPTAEVKINGVTFRVLGMEFDDQRKQKPTLRFTIRMTNNNVGGGVEFWGENCRLVLDGVERAPESTYIGRIAIHSSMDGEFIFPFPKGTRSAALEFWYRGESETTQIEIPN